MKEETFPVEGMMCAHCAAHVETALRSVSGVESARVSLNDKTATVSYTAPATPQALAKAVADEGYTLVV